MNPCLWKTQTIGRNGITLISGILSIVLSTMAGSLDPDEDAKLLKNLSISFGAVITGLQLLLWFGINTAVDVQANSPEQANQWLSQLGESTPDQINNMINTAGMNIGQMIDALNKAKTNLEGDEKTRLEKQIHALDYARAYLGADKGINIDIV